MIWGFPWSVPWGSHEDFFSPARAGQEMFADIPGGCAARFKPNIGYGQNVRLSLDGIPQGPAEYAIEDQVKELTGVWESRDTDHAAAVCPLGDWTSENIDIFGQLAAFLQSRASRIYGEFTVSPGQSTYGTGGAQFTAWALTSLKRFQNCDPINGRPTYGRLEIRLTESPAGTYNLTLYRDGVVMASGSRVGNGSITLAASNSSGIGGTVTITFTGVIAAGAVYFVARWPSQIKVHRKQTIFVALDFPRTAEETIYDDGFSNVFGYRSPSALAAGTWYVVPHQVDENGTESTGIVGGGATVTINAPPVAAGTPSYSSGGAAATIIQFTASTTGGATYNVYDSLATEILDLNTIAGTRAAGTGNLLHTLGAVGLGFTGKRYVLVRALNGGIEEGSLKTLEIEYAAGVVILPRPPRPIASDRVSTSGRALTVSVTTNTADQAGVAATLELYVYAWPGTPNYAVASASATIGTARQNLIQQNISFTVAADGWYGFAVRTVTAGATQSDNTDTYGPIWLSTAAPADASAIVRAGF